MYLFIAVGFFSFPFFCCGAMISSPVWKGIKLRKVMGLSLFSFPFPFAFSLFSSLSPSSFPPVLESEFVANGVPVSREQVSS